MATRNPRSGFNPKTGSRPAMRPQAPVLTNQAETSTNAQRLVRRPPMPFENPKGSKNVPAPSVRMSTLGIPYGQGKGVNPTRATYGSQPMSQSASFAAVGEPRAPRGYNPINSGFPTSGSARGSGPSAQPVRSGAKPPSSARGRQPVRAAETGKVAGDGRGLRNYLSR